MCSCLQVCHCNNTFGFGVMWTNMQDNELESVKPCALVWQTLIYIRKEEIMLTFLWIRHSFLKHIHLFKHAPTLASTHCGVPNTNLHIEKKHSCSNKFWTPSWSGNITWHPRRWLTWICSWYRGGHVFLTDSVLLLSLSHFICIVWRISLGLSYGHIIT
jgi:hypothetical protein